nr:bradykinin,Ala-Arg [Polistes rothneyi]prf//754921B polisteskinin R [Polistes rothneyi]
ARRPPGFTPFR